MNTALEDIVKWQSLLHPTPWRVEQDWTHEVIAADGYIVAKCRYPIDADEIVRIANEPTVDTLIEEIE